MAEGERFKVVLGASINNADGSDYCDIGIVYYDMGYSTMLAVEGVVKSEMVTLAEALQPVVQKLIGLGLEPPKNTSGGTR